MIMSCGEYFSSTNMMMIMEGYRTNLGTVLRSISHNKAQQYPEIDLAQQGTTVS